MPDHAEGRSESQQRRRGGAGARPVSLNEIVLMRKKILIAMLVMMCGCAAAPQKDGSGKNEEGKVMADMNEMSKNKDWAAVDAAKSAGPALIATVEPYLKNPDEVIRLLAVDCIAAAGGPAAPDLLIRALDDRNEQVRGNAINGL